jgi:hypothetical protein
MNLIAATFFRPTRVCDMKMMDWGFSFFGAFFRCFGLVQDLKSRGLLDETLVIWGGEFGRTVLEILDLPAALRVHGCCPDFRLVILLRITSVKTQADAAVEKRQRQQR